MPYEALYRKYRPQTFAQVIGQEHITSTLKNQVVGGHVAHAYLFCGTRGTGKTTVARIFARALNCTAAQDGEPCGRCAVCRDEGAMDIIEIDGGSNSGVSEVRDLIEKVRFAPVAGKYKVYIIDEVHTLSQNAFTALLKTLEEPPAHVVFILATTEPNKVLPTIHSRCQRFDFRRVSVPELCGHLASIFQREAVHYDEDGLRLIAQAGQGSVRDTMSIADQCLSFCAGNVTGEKVRMVLGSVSSEFLFDVAESILSGRDRELLGCVDEVISGGGDLGVFVRDLSAHFRNLMVLSACGGKRELLDCTDDEFNRFLDQAQRCPLDKAIRAIEILSETENSMRYLTRPRTKVEAALIKIGRPQDEKDLQSLLDRISTLEARLQGACIAPANEAKTRQPAQEEPEAPPFEPDAPAKESTAASPAFVPDRPQPEKKEAPQAKAPEGDSGEEMPDAPALEPAESPAAVSAVVFTKMSPAVRTLVKSWHYALDGGVLRYFVPVTFQAGMLATLKKLAPELTKKIERECPGITVEFVPEQEAPQRPAGDMRALAEQMFGKIKD